MIFIFLLIILKTATETQYHSKRIEALHKFGSGCLGRVTYKFHEEEKSNAQKEKNWVVTFYSNKEKQERTCFLSLLNISWFRQNIFHQIDLATIPL